MKILNIDIETQSHFLIARLWFRNRTCQVGFMGTAGKGRGGRRTLRCAGNRTWRLSN